MRETKRERRRVPLLISLLVSLTGPALALPDYGLADDDKSLLYEEMDEPVLSQARPGPGQRIEEATSLLDEVLKLETVLAYAQEHNPAIRAAQSRLVAAQQVPAQASAYDDPMVMWDNWNAPENLRLDRAGN
ncbi:MAG: hypothetical protein ACRERD_09120, partial [Candidatus Binatia bacterium]